MTFTAKMFGCQISEDAILPTRAHEDDAGWDIYAAEDFVLDGGESGMISTGCRFSIPKGYYGRIADRSSMASKHQIHCLAGVVDCGYTGEVKVILQNLSASCYRGSKGDRIAQLVITKISETDIIQTDDVVSFHNKHNTTNPGNPNQQRGDGGFGSTGR